MQGARRERIGGPLATPSRAQPSAEVGRQVLLLLLLLDFVLLLLLAVVVLMLIVVLLLLLLLLDFELQPLLPLLPIVVPPPLPAVVVVLLMGRQMWRQVWCRVLLGSAERHQLGATL